MSTKKEIRVIKVIKKETKEASKVMPAEKTKTAKQIARDLVSTVAGWVSEVQRKSSIDTKRALEKMFPGENHTGKVRP